MPMILNVAGTLVLTGLSWAVFEFVGRPVRDFFNLRREAKRLMMLHWNLPVAGLPFDDGILSGGGDKWKEARLEFSDTGARLISFDAAESPAAWFVKLMGYDPRKAGAALLVIANELGNIQEERDENFAIVELSLKLKEG